MKPKIESPMDEIGPEQNAGRKPDLIQNCNKSGIECQGLTEKAMEIIMNRAVFPVYQSYEHNRPAKKINLSEIVRMVQTPRIGPKKTAPALTPFDSDSKTKEAAQSSLYNGLFIDHDHDNLTAEGIRAIYDHYNMAYIVYTTSSHQQPGKGNRWKVFVPFLEPIGFSLWVEIAKGSALMTGADLAQARMQQVSFAPNKLTADSPYEAIINLDRPFIDPAGFHQFIQDCLSAYTKDQEAKQAKAEASIPKPRALNGYDGDIIQKINQAYRMDEVLQGAGYLLKNKKYLSPQSESGDPGVIILNRDGKETVYSHHGPADPLSNLNHGGHALDVLDALTVLRYGGDVKRAIRELAPIVDSEGQKQRQKEYAEQRSTAAADFDGIKVDENGDQTPFDLSKFSLFGKSKKMEGDMLNDVYVLGRLALLGQSTAWYAKPNTGKTLLVIYMLIEKIREGVIVGQNVFYVNADDTYKGLVHKLKIAEKWGFHMLAPGHGPDGNSIFKAEHLPGYLQAMHQSGTAKDKILILDTVKKFTDLMSKDKSSKFGEQVRQFVSHGGSVIMLAHANKHRDEDKKIVYAGTADLVDDADCAYTLDDIGTDDQGFRNVKFENFKCRGDVASEAYYKYDASSEANYFDRLDSVTYIKDDERQESENKHRLEVQLQKNQVMIDAIKESIEEGISSKTELIIEASRRSGVSRPKITKALIDHTGADVTKNQFWFIEIGEKNLKNYKLNYSEILGVKS